MFGFFTAGQWLLLVIVTEILIWDLLKGILKTISHVRTIRSYEKTLEKGIANPDEYIKGWTKKEEANENGYN